jgi:hypothetical protein
VTSHFTGLGLIAIELPAGSSISFTINNKDAGDNASAMEYLIKVAPA